MGTYVNPHGAFCETPLQMWTGAFVGAYVGGPCTGAPVGLLVGTYEGEAFGFDDGALLGFDVGT